MLILSKKIKFIRKKLFCNKPYFYSAIFFLAGGLLLLPIFSFSQYYSVEEYLKLPEEKIDIAEGALLIEKEIHPNLNVQSLLERINKMACQLDSLLNNPTYDTLTTINKFFFDSQQNKFKEDCKYLSDILNNKCGNCASFSLLYISLTNRLNLPFHPVLAPSHCFVRYETHNGSLNIETTHYGDTNPDEWYADYLKFNMDSINKDVYFKKISKKEMLAVMINSRANDYLETEEYEKAIRDCNTVLKIFPNMAEALITRASAHKKLSKIDKAIDDYTAALKTNPSNAEFFSNRGLLYEEAGQFEKAVFDYNRALTIKPTFAEVYYNRGIAYTRKELYQEAVNDFTRAIYLKPNYGEAYYNRGCVYNLAGMWKEAVLDYSKAIELGHIDANTYTYRGDCRNALGDKKGACEDWEIGFVMGYKSDNKKRILKYCKE